jgi:hypothetical protein
MNILMHMQNKLKTQDKQKWRSKIQQMRSTSYSIWFSLECLFFGPQPIIYACFVPSLPPFTKILKLNNTFLKVNLIILNIHMIESLGHFCHL